MSSLNCPYCNGPIELTVAPNLTWAQKVLLTSMLTTSMPKVPLRLLQAMTEGWWHDGAHLRREVTELVAKGLLKAYYDPSLPQVPFYYLSDSGRAVALAHRREL